MVRQFTLMMVAAAMLASSVLANEDLSLNAEDGLQRSLEVEKLVDSVIRDEAMDLFDGDEEDVYDEGDERILASKSAGLPSFKSTKAPTIKSTKAPTIKSTKAPTIKSTKAPTIKSTKAPSAKSSSSRRNLFTEDEE